MVLVITASGVLNRLWEQLGFDSASGNLLLGIVVFILLLVLMTRYNLSPDKNIAIVLFNIIIVLEFILALIPLWMFLIVLFLSAAVFGVSQATQGGDE